VNTLQRQARLFRLVRHTNPTAILAEGVEWSDGAATLRWRGPHPGTSTWDAGIDALLATYAPDARTQLHWTQAHQAPQAPTPLPNTGPTDRGGRDTPPTQFKPIWLPPATPDGLCTRCGQPWPCLSCGP
jgi:hypothetical protein